MINSMIYNAIGNNKKQHKIIAVFRSGREVTFTMNIIDLLKTDLSIKDIIDYETGEVIFSRD